MRILGYHRIATAVDSLVGLPRALPRADARGGRERRGADPARSRARAAARARPGPLRLRDLRRRLPRQPRSRPRRCWPSSTSRRRSSCRAGSSTVTPAFHWYEDPPPALSWDDVGELVVRRPRRRAVAHAHASAAAAGRRGALVRGDRGLEARDRGARPVFAHELLLPGRASTARARSSSCASAGYAAAVTTNPGVNAAAAICSSCAARSSTAPTTCASSAAKLDGLLDGETLLRRALHARRSRAA